MCEREKDGAEAQEHQNTTAYNKTELQVCLNIPWLELNYFPPPPNREKAFPAQVSQEAPIKSQNSHWSEI